MQSENSINEYGANFCNMIMYKNHMGTLNMGPNIIRLKNKFEVPNGESELNDENLTMRNQSYACMLGKTKEVDDLIIKHNWSIEPVNWYDQPALIQSHAAMVNIAESEIIDNYNQLINMMDVNELYNHKWLHYNVEKKI